EEKGLLAFMSAATWPDKIRSDPRYYDEFSKAHMTSPIPGLPPDSNQRHTKWHFVDVPFSPDRTRTRPPEQPNALEEIKSFDRIQQMTPQMQTYALPWLIHLLGDVHQPLHCTTRFTRDLPKGDRGGNRVKLRGSTN